MSQEKPKSLIERMLEANPGAKLLSDVSEEEYRLLQQRRRRAITDDQWHHLQSLSGLSDQDRQDVENDITLYRNNRDEQRARSHAVFIRDQRASEDRLADIPDDRRSDVLLPGLTPCLTKLALEEAMPVEFEAKVPKLGLGQIAGMVDRNPQCRYRIHILPNECGETVEKALWNFVGPGPVEIREDDGVEYATSHVLPLCAMPTGPANPEPQLVLGAWAAVAPENLARIVWIDLNLRA